MAFEPAHLDEPVDIVNGFPRPSWEHIHERVESIAAETERTRTWREVVIWWLDRTAESLDSEAQILAGKRLIVLVSDAGPDDERLLSFGEGMLHHLERLLGDVGAHDNLGPYVIIVISDGDRFIDYIDHYFPGGEYGGIGGLCIREGYEHVVIGPGDHSNRLRTIAHELTHDYLSARDMPLWVEEGIAQIMETLAIDTPRLGVDRELLQKHQEHWCREGLDSFWSGGAFSSPDESQMLAYQLAEILVRNIVSDSRRRFRRFVQRARWVDAGAAAATKCLRRSLGDYAAEFLGPCAWEPSSARPDDS